MSFNFKSINDNIENSVTTQMCPILSLQDFKTIWFKNEKDILFLLNQLNSLDFRPEITLDMIDLDDTLYSRDQQIQESQWSDNRAEKWNQVVLEKYWIANFTEKYYKYSDIVKSLLEVLISKQSLIITAWIPAIQFGKLNRLDINPSTLPVIVSSKTNQKTVKLVSYIVNNLKFKPWKIIIYDDKVGDFHKKIPSLSKILWIEIVVNKVELSKQDPTKILSLNQKIYISWEIPNFNH